MKLCVLLVIFGFSIVTASAQRGELLVTMGQLSVNGGIAEQPLAVKNNSQRLVELLWIECGFLDANGILISEGIASLTDLAPGEIGYVSPKAPHGQNATRAICRVSSVRP